MSTLRTAPSAAPAFRPPVGSQSILNGVMLFIIGLSLAGSGFASMRFSFLGLRVHTYLMVVGAFFPLLALTRLHTIPSRLLMEMYGFAGLYFATTIPGGINYGEGIKMFAAVTTIITMAMLVRSWDNFVTGTLGMCIGIAVLAVKGLEAESLSGGMEAMQEANRNAFSLFALPSILLGAFILMRGKRGGLLAKILLLGTTGAAILHIILNVNRSGWLGLALIALLIAREKSLKAALLFTVVGVVLTAIIGSMFSTDQIQARIADTRRGLDSDSLRWRLIKMSLRIGMENPLFGVSPQELPYILPSRLGLHGAVVSSHNVYGHILGGSGAIAFLLMFHIGWTLWSGPATSPMPPPLTQPYFEARRIMRLTLILWAFRGMFTHEIIYSPAFCMAIGLALGLELSYTTVAAKYRNVEQAFPRS